MSGYIGTQSVALSTVGGDIGGNVEVGGTLVVNGNIGIGTTTPNYPLQIKGPDNNAGSMLRLSSNNETANLGFTYDSILSDSLLRFYTGSIETGTATERMRINSLGGVVVGATDPSFGGADTGDLVATGGLNANGAYLVKSKVITLTTTLQDVLILGTRGTYAVTLSACDASNGIFVGSSTWFISVSNDYAAQGTGTVNVTGQQQGGWKLGSSTSANSRTFQARTTDVATNQWTLTVEIMSQYARSNNGTGVGSAQYLI
jgi:hypothetical protein